jgi:outer membrane protein insertion porin family
MKPMFARLMLAASVSALTALSAGDAFAQGARAQPAAPAPVQAIQHIVVKGTQRIEPETVLTYISLHEGDVYSEQQADSALKTLYATGLFADVKMDFDGATLNIHVVENPIINQVVFEGNSKVSDKDLTKEVQLKPRGIFTRAKVQADIQRIIEVYRRNGKFAASVDPQIIQRPQNRVDLIFSVNEGPTTGVARINFIGNHVFDDNTLRGQIATEQSAWWKFLATNDNYDPDRLTYDREQLRRFYVSHGYADFHVVSAVAELTPDRKAFYINFTVEEGPLYHFGKIDIDSAIKELPASKLRPLVAFRAGDLYNADLVQKAIDSLTNAAGTHGYAFAEVHPRIARNRDKRTIDVIMKIDQGPRVYVERINVVGNTRTLDKVIRREMRLTEGDAFNRVLLDRSRTRIRGLGFFKDVDIKQSPGSAPDRTDLTIAVTEQSTGELSVGAGYSSTSSLVGEFSYTERNLFGRGQYLRASIAISSISKQAQLSFTEPWFLDRPLQAGFDLYKVVTQFNQADYQGDIDAAGVRFGFPTSEFGSVALRYTFKIQKVTPFAGAPLSVQLASGTRTSSAFGYSFGYNTLDDTIKPTRGMAFTFSQDLAGLGGELKYLSTTADFSYYTPVIWDTLIGSITGSVGDILGYDGQTIPIDERFFKGGDSFPGFQLAGIGPRDTLVPGDAGAVGGNVYAIGNASIRLPDFLPSDYGITTSLFTYFGTLGRVDGKVFYNCNAAATPIGSSQTCVRDNLAFRASAGIGVGWKSPFGPIQIDFGIPLAKAPYDRAELIHFSAGTGL